MNRFIVSIVMIILSQAAFSQTAGSLRDSRQFRFGFEPTVTNLPIILESGGAVVKKILTGKGEGVLSADMPVSTKYRERYLDIIRKECPDCKITEARESHGELSFHIEFPDGFYIRSSLDAGALEWQTKPSTITEIKDHLPVLQKEVFDQSKKAGMNIRLEATGGHVTFSGFGNDSFWYGNYLKFRTQHTDLDWGFFGKDSYNATPVGLWDPEQQLRYQKVHLEHDQKWEVFLKKMEVALKEGTPDAELMKIFRDRDVMPLKEYSAKLLEIYHNPKLENKWLGKRSKPKYVANKPYKDMIENRAIRPQKGADDLLKQAQFIEAEAWYVKDQINHKLEVPFHPGSFTPNGKKVAAQNSRKVIESLGLQWKDYVRFSTIGDVKLRGDEKGIAKDFQVNEYGAGKRDQLFHQVRDHFLNKPEWSADESVFMSELLNEMSYTVPEAIENGKHLASRIRVEDMLELEPEQINRISKQIHGLSEKFPAATQEILKPVQESLQGYVKRSLVDSRVTEGRFILPLVESKKEILSEMIQVQTKMPKVGGLGIFADLVLEPGTSPSAAESYFQAIIRKRKSNELREIPARFHEVVARFQSVKNLEPLLDEATNAVSEWFADPANAHLKVTDQDAELMNWLSERRPKLKNRILSSLRKHYLDEIRANEFGLKNFYPTSVSFDYLVRITPEEEKPEFIEMMLENVRAMHKIKNDSDSQAFIDRIEKYRKPTGGIQAKAPCGVRFMSSLKQMFRY